MATVSKHRVCDLCGDVVATKSLLWHTDKDYVTVRVDEAPGYVNQEQNTVVRKEHYCYHCWAGLFKQVPKEEA